MNKNRKKKERKIGRKGKKESEKESVVMIPWIERRVILHQGYHEGGEKVRPGHYRERRQSEVALYSEYHDG